LDHGNARLLVQCNGNGEIDAGVFSYSQQSTKAGMRMIRMRVIRYAVPIPILVGATAPASATDYYIVRGPDKKCNIVETRPTDKTTVLVGDKAYMSRGSDERDGRRLQGLETNKFTQGDQPPPASPYLRGVG
jgi:hypothetical protein